MQLDQQEIICIVRESGAPDWWIGIGVDGQISGSALGWIERITTLAADAESKRIQAEGMVTVGQMREQVAAALAQEREGGQKWFDAVTAQHKQAILAERKANAKVAKSFYNPKHGLLPKKASTVSEPCFLPLAIEAAILARGQ